MDTDYWSATSLGRNKPVSDASGHIKDWIELLCTVYEANRDCYSRQTVYDLSLKCNQTFSTQVSLLVELNSAHIYDKRIHLCRSVSNVAQHLSMYLIYFYNLIPGSTPSWKPLRIVTLNKLVTPRPMYLCSSSIIWYWPNGWEVNRHTTRCTSIRGLATV